MKKLNSVILYECTTSFKYIWLFYIIQYAIVALITAIIAISTGSFDEVGTNCLEVNTLIYVGIIGVMGFTEDFKMLIQNGFTRKFIFIATVSLFMFISGIMALVDTIVGNVLHYVWKDYSSIFGNIYGYDNVFTNWIWLFLANMLVCSLLYLAILVINKIGKTVSILLGVILGGAVLLIIALFRFVLSSEFVSDLMELAIKAMGFIGDGTINFFFPILTMLILVGVLSICSYIVIHRTELE